MQRGLKKKKSAPDIYYVALMNRWQPDMPLQYYVVLIHSQCNTHSQWLSTHLQFSGDMEAKQSTAVDGG